jgi:hypothetical protein
MYGYGETDTVGYGKELGNNHFCGGPANDEITAARLPPLFWLNYFSARHVERLGLGRVLSVPAYDVRRYDNGGMSVFLGPSKFDVDARGDEFLTAVVPVAEQLGLQSWYLPPGHPLQLPPELILE